MLVTAGLLYREADQRLCVSYLVDEQAASGNGLIALGMALGALALHAAATSGNHQAGGAPSSRSG